MEHNNNHSNADINTSYFSEYTQAYIKQAQSGYNLLLSPQLLNTALKNINMDGQSFSYDEIEKMVMNPHNFESELRRLSLYYYRTVSIYKQLINYQKILLDFDWEPIPYIKDGKAISLADMNSNAFKRDYAIMKKFFDQFNVKHEFKKVLFNALLYDTYYTYLREYDGHLYLQEMPSDYCMIDADSYLGYLYSLDFSYFMQSGVDINAYASELRIKYSELLELKESQYNPNLPDRNGKWVYWYPMHPDNAWVFKYNNGFAGSVPPIVDMLLDYTKLDKYKELEETKKELEAYKVIFATVPRLTNNKSANQADNFAISAPELGKFVNAVKSTLKVDFKAAPLQDFKAFDFSPSGAEKDLLETELRNMMTQSGLSDSITNPSSMNVSSSNIYKTVTSQMVASMYPQFEKFCEYHINKNTKKYKFKIKFVGTIFDREERRKNADADMEKGIITPAIFSSRGIQVTDATNVMNMMYSIGIPEMFRPIKTASTMSSAEKESVGRPAKSESELTDSGAQTVNIGANIDKKEAKV